MKDTWIIFSCGSRYYWPVNATALSIDSDRVILAQRIGRDESPITVESIDLVHTDEIIDDCFEALIP